MSSTETASNVETYGQYLSFTLGDEDYGVNILRVQEIKGWEEVRPLPDTPKYIKGDGWGGSSLLSTATRYGNYAMEHMINDILAHGGQRKNLAIKIFGGGKIISGLSSVGKKNIEFVRCYIKSENLDLVGEDVGDIYPRKVVFYPASGRVRVKKLKHMHNDTIVKREKEYQHDIEEAPVEGTVELF